MTRERTQVDDPGRVIVSLSHARTEAEPVVEEAAEAEPAEPEVIKKGGKPEEEAAAPERR